MQSVQCKVYSAKYTMLKSKCAMIRSHTQCTQCFGQSANCTQCPVIAGPSNLQPPLYFSFHCFQCVHCSVQCTVYEYTCIQCIFLCFHCVVCIVHCVYKHVCQAQCSGYCICSGRVCAYSVTFVLLHLKIVPTNCIYMEGRL